MKRFVSASASRPASLVVSNAYRFLKLVFPLALLGILACGSSDEDSDDEDYYSAFRSPGAGSESYNPGNIPGDSSLNVTDVACSSSNPCGYWYCSCEDGAVVNASFCYHGYCTTASAICPSACDNFDHGDWSGSASGGPQQNNQAQNDNDDCDDADDCDAEYCYCSDGWEGYAQWCDNHRCVTGDALCAEACYSY